MLGGGDESLEFQKFTLKQAPLTYVSSPTASGALSTLQVRVNDVLWEEAQGLHDLQPHDRAYIARIADDGKAVVTFGNGIHGARLPTGADNVVAAYAWGPAWLARSKPASSACC